MFDKQTEGACYECVCLVLWWLCEVVAVVMAAVGLLEPRLSISISEFCLQIENDGTGGGTKTKE